MKLKRLIELTLFSMLTSVWIQVAANVTTLGVDFVIMTPVVGKTDISGAQYPLHRLFLWTPVEKEVMLSVRSYWYKNIEGLDTLIEIFSHKFVVFDFPQKYRPTPDTGLKGSIRLNSTEPFSVTMLSASRRSAIDTFQVIPVSHWGVKYIFISFGSGSIIHLVAGSDPNQVLIEVNTEKAMLPHILKLFGGRDVKAGASSQIHLRRYESFQLLNCNSREEITGSTIIGQHPLGVISGSCVARCQRDKNNHKLIYDINSEMLMPISTFGKEFITLTIPLLVSGKYFVALAYMNKTRIHVSENNYNQTSTHFIQNAGETIQLNITENSCLIISNKGIQLYFVIEHTCSSRSRDKDEDWAGYASVTAVIPSALFYIKYTWFVPKQHSDATHYLMVITEHVNVQHLRLDDFSPMKKFYWVSVVGKPRWLVGHSADSPGIHTMVSREEHHFGCYVYSLLKSSSSIRAVDFVIAAINPCVKSVESMVPGDHLDNDCDGRVDEELTDGDDNDKDGLKDEDLIGVNDTFGAMCHLFIVTAPPITHTFRKTAMFLYFYTDSHVDVKITISSLGFESNLRLTKLVSRNATARYQIKPKYLSQAITGYTGSFRVTGSGLFGVQVVVFQGKNQVESFLAHPVSAWEKLYFVFTLKENPFIQFVSYRSLTRIVMLLNGANDLKIFIENKPYRKGDLVVFNIGNGKSFQISLCGKLREKSLTGTKISGTRPFGVISGSCLYQDQGCDTTDPSTDMSVDMLMPTVMYGSEFIVFQLKTVVHQGEVQVISSQAYTSVYVSITDGLSIKYQLQLEGESRTIDIPDTAVLIRSSKPVQMFYVVTKACTWHNDSATNSASSDVGFSILVPSALFYFTYIWSMEMLPEAEHYVAVVAHGDFFRRIFLDDECLDDRGDIMQRWDIIKGKPSWYIGHVKVNSSLHILEATKSSPFGCYVYGASAQYMYLQTVNYRITFLNLPCMYMTMFKLEGDQIDNDCDGRVDEEIKDNIDDDMDRLIDEDTYLPVTLDSAETMMNNKECPPLSWGENCTQLCLHCYMDCEDKTGVCLHCKIGFKNPLSNCTESCGLYEFGVDCQGNCTAKCGPDVDCYERRYGNCKRCPEFRWGKDCLRECKNCADDCDKSYGNCTLCLPGYQSPETGCEKECPALTYGHNCLGSCLAKCDGKDCYERVFGKCTACHNRTWGEECTRSCENCSDPCRVSNGICDMCRPGFKNPHLGCNQKCGIQEYGTDCRFPCKIKCGGADCYEREFGTCRVNGEFGPWQMWACTEDCSDIRVKRTRLCDSPPPSLGGDPCDGEYEDFKVSDCYYDDICPEKCPEYQWGGGCIFDCYNCELDCHKFNGSCTSCKAGFKNPDFSCKEACEENEWGENCLGDCLMTCGSDCVDRVTGACRHPEFLFFLLYIFVIGVPILFIILICAKRRKEIEEITEITKIRLKSIPSESDPMTETTVSNS